MVRRAGSVNEVNSLSDPTGEFLRSVVRRMSGKIAKRIKGMESRAPTNTEPSASSAPRKDRRSSTDDCQAERFLVAFPGSSARAHIHISCDPLFGKAIH